MQPLQAMADTVHGAYLLIVISEPASQDHKDVILRKISKGFLSWDMETTGCCISAELQYLVDQAPVAEEAKNGEKLVQFVSENLVTEVLINPLANTLQQCMRNLLGSFTRHKHVIHAGYAFSGSGSWIVQDGTYSFSDFVSHFRDPDLDRMLKAYKKSISVHVHCIPEGEWASTGDRDIPKYANVEINPDDRSPKFQGVANFVSFLSRFVQARPLEDALEASDVVGNIRFSRPTLYVFPGGQGDSSLFGVNGFNMLVDGGFSRKPCFWDFARHLDRVDAVLISRVSQSNIAGIGSLLKRKALGHVYPQIGHVFCNAVEGSRNSPDGDKDKDSLLVSVVDEGRKMVANLRHLGLRPQECSRDANVVRPINLYHKVGHGTLDMYVLNPAKDSKEVKEFLQQWQAETISESDSKVGVPLPNLVSICALLIWRPADPTDSITRVLFPGSVPQSKIFEGLESLKGLVALKSPVCTEESLQKATVTATKTPNKVVRIIAGTPIDDKGGRASPQRLTKATEDLSKQVHKMKEKKEIRAPLTATPTPKIPLEPKRKPSPIIPPSKLVTNGTPAPAKNAAPPKTETPRAPPKAKGLKDANNKKTVESKNRTKKDVLPRKAPVKISPATSKIEKKPVEKKVSSESENGQTPVERPVKVTKISEPAKDLDKKDVPLVVEAVVGGVQVEDNKEAGEIIEEGTQEVHIHHLEDQTEQLEHKTVADVVEDHYEEHLDKHLEEEHLETAPEDALESLGKIRPVSPADIVQPQVEEKEIHIEDEKPVALLPEDSREIEALHAVEDEEFGGLIKENIHQEIEHAVGVEDIKQMPVQDEDAMQQDQANIVPPPYTVEEKHELEAIEDRFLETAILGVGGDWGFAGTTMQPIAKLGGEQEKHSVPDYPKTPDEVAELPIHEVAPTESYEYYAATRGPLAFDDSLESDELQQIHEQEVELPPDHHVYHEPTSLEPEQLEPVHSEPEQPEPIHPEPEQPQPIHPEPEQPQPIHPEPEQLEHIHQEQQPIHSEPEKPESVHQEIKQTEHIHLQPEEFEHAHTKPDQPEHIHMEPGQQEHIHLEQDQREPVHLEPEHQEPIYVEPEHREPVYLEQEHREPVHLEQDQREPVHLEQDQHEPVHLEQDQHEPVHLEQEQREPVHPESEQLEPVHLEQEQQEPIHQEQQQQEPIHQEQQKQEPVHQLEHIHLEHEQLEHTHLEHEQREPVHIEQATVCLDPVHHESIQPEPIVHSQPLHLEPVPPESINLETESIHHTEAISMDLATHDEIAEYKTAIIPPLSSEMIQHTVTTLDTSELPTQMGEPVSATHADQRRSTPPPTTISDTTFVTSDVTQSDVTISSVTLDKEPISLEKHVPDIDVLYPVPSQLSASVDSGACNMPESRDDRTVHAFQATFKNYDDETVLPTLPVAEYDADEFGMGVNEPYAKKICTDGSAEFPLQYDQNTTIDQTDFNKQQDLGTSKVVPAEVDKFELPHEDVHTHDIIDVSGKFEPDEKGSENIPKSPEIITKSEANIDLLPPTFDDLLAEQTSSGKDSSQTAQDSDVLLSGHFEQHSDVLLSGHSEQNIAPVTSPTPESDAKIAIPQITHSSDEEFETETGISREIFEKADADITATISQVTLQHPEKLQDSDVTLDTFAEHYQPTTLETTETDVTSGHTSDASQDGISNLDIGVLKTDVLDSHSLVTRIPEKSEPDVISIDTAETVEKPDSKLEPDVLKLDLDEHAITASYEKPVEASSVDIEEMAQKSDTRFEHDFLPHHAEHDITSSEKSQPDVASVDISEVYKSASSLEHVVLLPGAAEHAATTTALETPDPDVIPADILPSTLLTTDLDKHTVVPAAEHPEADFSNAVHDVEVAQQDAFMTTASQKSDVKSVDILQTDSQITDKMQHQIDILPSFYSAQTTIPDASKETYKTVDTSETAEEHAIKLQTHGLETNALNQDTNTMISDKSKVDIESTETAEDQMKSSTLLQTESSILLPTDAEHKIAETDEESTDSEDNVSAHPFVHSTEQLALKDQIHDEHDQHDVKAAIEEIKTDHKVGVDTPIPPSHSSAEHIASTTISDHIQDVTSIDRSEKHIHEMEPDVIGFLTVDTQDATTTAEIFDDHEKHGASTKPDATVDVASKCEIDEDSHENIGKTLESHEKCETLVETSATLLESSSKLHQELDVILPSQVDQHNTTPDPASMDILTKTDAHVALTAADDKLTSIHIDTEIEAIPSEGLLSKGTPLPVEPSAFESTQMEDRPPHTISTEHPSTGIIFSEPHNIEISNLESIPPTRETFEDVHVQHDDAYVFQPISAESIAESTQHDLRLLGHPPDLIAASETSKVHLGTEGDRTRSPCFRRESATSSPLDNIPEVEREDSIEGQIQMGSALKADFPEVVTLSDGTSPSSPLSPQEHDESKRPETTYPPLGTSTHSSDLGVEHEVSSDPKGSSAHTSDNEDDISFEESYIRVRHSPDNMMTASFYDETTSGKDVLNEGTGGERPFLGHAAGHHGDHDADIAISSLGDSDTSRLQSSLITKSSSDMEDDVPTMFASSVQQPSDRQEYEGYYEAHAFAKDEREDDDEYDDDDDIATSPQKVVLSPKECASLDDKDSEDIAIVDPLESETQLIRQSDDPWRPESRESGDARNLSADLRNLPDVAQSPMHSGSYVSAEDSDDERNLSPQPQLQYPVADSSSTSDDSQVESARGPLHPDEKYYDIANVPNQGAVAALETEAGAGQGAQWTDDYVHVRTPEEDVWQGVHYSSDDNEEDEEDDDAEDVDEEEDDEKYYEGENKQYENEGVPEKCTVSATAAAAAAAVPIEDVSDSADDEEYSSGHSLPGFEMDSPQARHTPLEFTNRHAREKHFAEAAANNNLSSPSSGTDDNRSPQEEKSIGASSRVPFDDWGEPMSLPSPPPPSDTKVKAKAAPIVKKISSNGNGTTNTNVTSTNISTNINGKQAAVCGSPKRVSTKRQETSKRSPVYVDLAYVPHHASLNYCNVEFFRSVRARYYVFSGTDPSKEVLDALLEAKGSWEDTELDVTIVPTYDTDTLGYWYALNEHALAKHRIDLAPSASRCTINLQDHETSCSAYRLEF